MRAAIGLACVRLNSARPVPSQTLALPALVLEHELLDGDIGAVGVEQWQSLVERRPAAMDLVCEHELPRLVIEFEIDVLAKISEPDLASQRRAKAPDLVRPVFEGAILGRSD